MDTFDFHSRVLELLEQQNFEELCNVIRREDSDDFLKANSEWLLERLILEFLEHRSFYIIRSLKLINHFISPVSRLSVYLRTIDALDSLTLNVHFAKHLADDLSVLNEVHKITIRERLLPKLHSYLLRFVLEQADVRNTTATIYVIFLRAVLKVYIKCDANDPQMRLSFIRDVLMRRSYLNKIVRDQMFRMLKYMPFEPHVYSGLWLPCDVTELPYFILNECIDDVNTGLMPAVYHPLYLLKLINKPCSDLIMERCEDLVFVRNMFMLIVYVARMIEPLSVYENKAGYYKDLLVSIVYTNGTFKIQSSDTFTTFEVFALLMENFAVYSQIVFIFDLVDKIINQELPIRYPAHTLASIIDAYRNGFLKPLEEFDMYREKVLTFYDLCLTAKFNSPHESVLVYTALTLLIQTHGLSRQTDGSVLFYVHMVVLPKIRQQVEHIEHTLEKINRRAAAIEPGPQVPNLPRLEEPIIDNGPDDQRIIDSSTSSDDDSDDDDLSEYSDVSEEYEYIHPGMPSRLQIVKFQLDEAQRLIDESFTEMHRNARPRTGEDDPLAAPAGEDEEERVEIHLNDVAEATIASGKFNEYLDFAHAADSEVD